MFYLYSRRYLPAYEAMEVFLNQYGRTRLIYPVYMALVKNGEDAELAREIFAGARENYHPLTNTYIEYGFNKSQ